MEVRVDTDQSTDLLELRARVKQLQTALDTRIVIEQAKGILAERFHLPVDDAFLLLRYAARSSRTKLHVLAEQVVEGGATPHSLTVAIARQQRWRAASQRERAEAHRERAHADAQRARRLAERLHAEQARSRGL
jgi:ANTAR domain